MTTDNPIRPPSVDAKPWQVSISARRLRRIRAIRWMHTVRAMLLLALLAAVPVVVFMLVTDGQAEDDLPEVPAEVLIRTFSGSGSESTGVFVVASQWTLKWQLDGLATDSLRIAVRSSDGEEVGFIRQRGLGSGEEAFEEGGVYRLVVTSTGDWKLRVVAAVDVTSAG